MKINNVRTYINSTSLFTRLAAFSRKEDDEASYFKYQLTVEPMSLFKNSTMRKPDKTSLWKALAKDNDVLDITAIKSSSCTYVIDGGALIHRVCWVNVQKHYGKGHYGKGHIVFDGYETQTTKSAEHLRRSENHTKCPDVEVKEEGKIAFTKERFLSNTSNKSQIIRLISRYLADNGNESKALAYYNRGRLPTVFCQDLHHRSCSLWLQSCSQSG